MKTTDVKKEFDCVEFKRQAQARIYERIKDLSPEEETELLPQGRRRRPAGPVVEGGQEPRSSGADVGPVAQTSSL